MNDRIKRDLQEMIEQEPVLCLQETDFFIVMDEVISALKLHEYCTHFEPGILSIIYKYYVVTNPTFKWPAFINSHYEMDTIQFIYIFILGIDESIDCDNSFTKRAMIKLALKLDLNGPKLKEMKRKVWADTFGDGLSIKKGPMLKIWDFIHSFKYNEIKLGFICQITIIDPKHFKQQM